MKSEAVRRDALRIGVFVCHCGTNIGGVVDVPSVVEYAKTLPHVVYTERNLYTCATDGLAAIKKAIKEYTLNRVVVASCTPRTHAPLFMSTCEAAGLNPYLFEFVNIRDQCSWVHMREREKATEKAKRLVAMGVAKAALLEPLEKFEVGVEQSAMVIGGGISGLTAASSLANHGFNVYLVEKEEELGGMLRCLHRIFPVDKEPSEILAPVIDSVQRNRRIKVLTSSLVDEVKGYIGNFDVTVTNRKGKGNTDLKVGSIIVASGAAELKPNGLYGYGKLDNVLTQLELEEGLEEEALDAAKKVVMIQCVGSRGGEVPYCSRICCMTAIKNAVYLKELDSDREVTVLYRDIQMHGTGYEDLYRKAREMGVRFLKYGLEPFPTVSKRSQKLLVEFYDEILGRHATQESDLVVLSTPLIQHEEGMELAKILRVPLGQDGFFFEAHVKLRPVDFSTDGIYLCGTAQSPKDAAESVSQALAAVARSLPPLTKKKVESEPIVSVVNKDICVGCGSCASLCRYNAIGMKFEGQRLISEVNPLLCRGCGVCGAACPAHAIEMQGFTDKQIFAQISAALNTPPPGGEPTILGFCCNWCSYAGADMAGVSRFQYPPNIKIIRVMCSGRVSPNHILWAFLNGADGVFVSGCHPGDCHYESGNEHAKQRVQKLKTSMETAGLDPRRLRLEWVSASEGKRFADLVTEFTREVSELGPSRIGMSGVLNV